MIGSGNLDKQLRCINGTVVRTHPCAAGGKNLSEFADHELGRSRGGFSAKIHLLCGGHRPPLHFRLTPGQEHEATAIASVLAGVQFPLPPYDNGEMAWPVQSGADKGDRPHWIDGHLLELGMIPVIPSKANEDRSDRLVDFDREAYRTRNIIERLIGWLKDSRRVFARFEKTAMNFGGFIKMAFIQRYLRLATT